MKIKNVTRVTLDTPVPVYDLCVPETSNFTLTAGPVVHNSKDLVDARAIAFYLAIKDNVGESHLEWLFEEKSLKSASGQE